jgi:hypothetical protein
MVTFGISLTNDHLKISLNKILKNDLENREDYILLLESVMAESTVTCELFMRLMLGEKLPAIPSEGTLGYVHFNNLGYGIDKELYKNSEYCKHGFLPCMITRIRSYAAYTPLVILLPDINGNSKECSITIENFFPGDISE